MSINYPPLQPSPSVIATDIVDQRASNDAIKQELSRPFGTIRSQLAIPSVIILISMYVFYNRIIILGSMKVDIPIIFDMNAAVGILILVLGGVALVRTAITAPNTLLRQTNITIVILTLLVVYFIFNHSPNLGTFTYTQKLLDYDTLLVLALIGVSLILVQRGSRISILSLILITLMWVASSDGFGFKTFTDLFTSKQGLTLLRNLAPPQWSDFAGAIDPLFVTVKIAIASTVIGVVGALPLSILAARNTTPSPIFYNLVRAITNIIRAVPALFVALLLIPFYGLNANAAIVGLGLHSISVLTKIFAESIDAVRSEPQEALRGAGANGIKQFRWGIMPQALPVLVSYSLFNFESNVRDSTVAAFVGAGGIGFLIFESIGYLSYHSVSTLLAVLIVAVIFLDRLSDFIRSRII